MALDTRDKRASVIAFALPWTVYPNADGTVGAADRQQAAFLYPGILASVATVVLGAAGAAWDHWRWDDEE